MPTSEDVRQGAACRRAGRLLLLLGSAALLSGCLQLGESGVDAELARVAGIKGFGVVSADPHKAVIAAKGGRVVVTPPDGSCLASDSIDVSRDFAFIVVSDCALEDTEVASADDEEMLLPDAFPGVVTVSVSGDPMDAAAGSTADAIERLKAFLRTPEGMSRLGRSENADMVNIEEMRTVGDTLYVLVEDGDPDAMPVLSQRFWRAFCEVNGRLVLATVSGFRDRPMSDETMLRKLAAQVVSLRVANGEDKLAAAAAELPAALPPERGRSGPVTKRAPYLSPDVLPMPKAAKAADVQKSLAAAVSAAPAAGKRAPAKAVAAPKRPKKKG